MVLVLINRRFFTSSFFVNRIHQSPNLCIKAVLRTDSNLPRYSTFKVLRCSGPLQGTTFFVVAIPGNKISTFYIHMLFRNTFDLRDMASFQNIIV
jgi:hypothetical protein